MPLGVFRYSLLNWRSRPIHPYAHTGKKKDAALLQNLHDQHHSSLFTSDDQNLLRDLVQKFAH